MVRRLVQLLLEIQLVVRQLLVFGIGSQMVKRLPVKLVLRLKLLRRKLLSVLHVNALQLPQTLLAHKIHTVLVLQLVNQSRIPTLLAQVGGQSSSHFRASLELLPAELVDRILAGGIGLQRIQHSGSDIPFHLVDFLDYPPHSGCVEVSHFFLTPLPEGR